jgi:hypothetical protein
MKPPELVRDGEHKGADVGVFGIDRAHGMRLSMTKRHIAAGCEARIY